MNPSTSALFTPVALGRLTLSHRVAMAPLTRLRSGADGVPTPLVAEYYSQRATPGGLIIAEATAVAEGGRAYLGSPGIYNDRQVEGWKKVTDAVHGKGGLIFLQLWHAGRDAHVDLTGGAAPVAPSVVPFEGAVFLSTGWTRASAHRALALEEIPGLIETYRQAALRAKAAGFDGVELHGANGYLPDQFLQDGSNQRTDRYGGSPENRARFMLEVTEALVSVWGGDRVAVRLSPSSAFNEMSDTNPRATYGFLVRALNRFGLAYLHLIEPRIKGSELIQPGVGALAAEWLRSVFTGKIIAAGGFEGDAASALIAEGTADLVAFGRHFIANPDLPLRLQYGYALNAYDRATFYGGTEKGFTDYPFHPNDMATCECDGACAVA